MTKPLRSSISTLAIVLLFGCGPSNEVLMVQGGTLQSCPAKTLEQMADGFMGSPSWESITADDGFDYVNVSGDITFREEPVRALVQFKLNDDETFEFNAIEFDDVPQGALLASGLMQKMCDD